MNDAVAPAPRRRNWLKIIGLMLGILLLLIVVLFFVATSSGFIRSVILPKVGKSIGADVTASDVSLSPFKEIVLRDLKVQAPGKDPLFTSPEVKVQYRLLDIIRGNYNIDLVSISSPVIALVETPDKKSNVDPIIEALGESEDEPMNMDLKKLVITDGTVRYEKKPSPEGSYISELTKLNVNIDGLKTGGVGKLAIEALFAMQSSAPAPGTNGSMTGTLKGAMDLGITPMFAPTVIRGNTRMDITSANGGYAMASGMAMVFEADVTPTEVKQLALRILKGQGTLAELAASGPFSMEKNEGVLDVRLSNVDRNTLNLFTADSGMDFGKTAINSTNRIQISNAGNTMGVTGSFSIDNFQVTRTNQSTPVLNLQALYDANIDQAASNATFRALTLTGSQGGRQFLKGALSAPMVVNWGNPNQSVGDSSFVLTLDQFNLADWKPFMGDAVDSGLINSRVEVLSKAAGQQITFTHKTGIEELSMTTDGTKVAGISILLSGDGEAKQMEQFASKYVFELSQAGTKALQVTGSGAYNTKTEEARGDAKGSAAIPVLVQIAGVQDASFNSGEAQFNLNMEQKGKNSQVKGQFNLVNLTGAMGSNIFRNFAANSTLDVAMDEQKAEIRKAVVELSQDAKPGGTMEISGTCGLSNAPTRIKLALKDLNQNVLRTFLQPALGENILASIAINGQGSIDYDPQKSSSITADFKMSNFVVKDPKGTMPAKPLEAGLAFEATMNKDVTEIRKGLLTLTPTERAKNQLQLAGKFDMSNTNFTSGNLKVTADSLDMTTYYNLFQGQGTDAAAAEAQPKAGGTASSQPAQPGGGPEPEAEPMILPLTNFVFEVAIDRFFLSEMDIANMVINTRIDGGLVDINPIRMSINGAPLVSTVKLNMGVPGYRYDVVFGMTNVPFAPLVNTFTPERKGQVGGAISASTQIKGAGTTGENLQKNLNGYFLLATTNLNLDISELKNPMLKTIINVVGLIPTIIKNPNAGLSSLAGSLFGGSSSQGTAVAGGAWGDELLKSPIDVIEANAEMGSGSVRLQRAFVRSPAFEAQAEGKIDLAKVLTNSPVNIPLHISIKRSLAESVNLVPPGTPTNAAYVKLPDYVTVKGTVGEPKADINKMALVGTALQQYGGNIPGVDQKTGNLLQGLGGILTGRKATNAPPAAGTNAPSGTAPRQGGLLEGLGGILGGGSQQPATQPANAPASTNVAPANTNTNPVGNLIQGIFGPRKK